MLVPVFMILQLVFILLLSQPRAGNAEQWQEIVINGCNSTDADTVHDQHTHCSLEDAIKTVGDYAKIVVNTTQLYLRSSVTFSNKNGLVLCGNSSINKCNITCLESAGLGFFNIHYLSISSLRFVNCGYRYTRQEYNLTAAIIISACNHIEIAGIIVYNSSQDGLWMIENNGNVSIDGSAFGERDSVASTSNGVTVQLANLENVQYRVYNCTFAQGLAPQRCSAYVIDDISAGGGLNVNFGRNVSGLNFIVEEVNFCENSADHGGGISISFTSGSKNNHLEVTNCTFWHNGGTFGGGAAVIFNEMTFNNFVQIENCKFANNYAFTCTPGNNGGGLIIGLRSAKSKPHPSENEINRVHIHSTQFINNSAQYGGGVSLFSSGSGHTNIEQYYLNFVNCTWKANTALFGSAVDISIDYDDKSLPARNVSKIHFAHSSFINNIISYVNESPETSFINSSLVGKGAFHVSFIDVTFTSSVLFIGNFGSALAALVADIHFKNCTGMWINNCGSDGGAITLTGLSSIWIEGNSSLNFTNNHASNRGGALYAETIDNHLLPISLSCPVKLQVNFQNVTEPIIVFKNNSAANARGDSMYIASFEPCLRFYQVSSYETLLNSNKFGQFFLWEDVPAILEGQIATAAVNVTPTAENLPSRNGNVNISGTSSILQAIPGEKIPMPVNFTDQMNSSVHEMNMFVAYKSEMGSTEMLKMFTNCSELHIYGEEGSNSLVTLSTLETPITEVNIPIGLLPCPPGHELRILDDTKSCKCILDQYYVYGIYTCGANLSLNINNGIWAGYINDTNNNQVFVTSVCNYWLCMTNSSSTVYNLPYDNFVGSTTSNGQKACYKNRQGILCGSCVDGFTVYYHSPTYSCKRAQHCHYGFLYYFLLELLPLAAMFILVTSLGVNLASGWFQGLVVYAQLFTTIDIMAGGMINRGNATEYLIYVSKMLYNFLSFKFFYTEILSFCLLENASTLHIMAFHYITLLWAFFMILLVTGIVHLCAKRTVKLFPCLRFTALKNSFTKGISTWLILCYTNCTYVSMELLTPAVFYGQNWTTEGLPIHVKHDGNIRYFDVPHLPFAIPAIICLIVITTIPPLMLMYPLLAKILLLLKLDESRGSKVLAKCFLATKLKPLYDIFQSCFKDECRFFAGVYFFYRLLMLIVQMVSTTFTGYYLLCMAVLGMILCITSLAQPYENRIHNIIDTLLFTNLAFIVGSSETILLWLTEEDWISTPTLQLLSTVQAVLVVAPLLVAGGGCFLALAYKIYSHYQVKQSDRADISYLDVDRSHDSPWLSSEEESELSPFLNHKE